MLPKGTFYVTTNLLQLIQQQRCMSYNVEINEQKYFLILSGKCSSVLTICLIFHLTDVEHLLVDVVCFLMMWVRVFNYEANENEAIFTKLLLEQIKLHTKAAENQLKQYTLRIFRNYISHY